MFSTQPPSPSDLSSQLRNIIINDHFGTENIPHEIVDQWLTALLTLSDTSRPPPPLPPGVKGFYGGSLLHSMPIELARGSYKHITHETIDREKVEYYAHRMLVSLDLLDVPSLSLKEPVIAALALWHRALAEVRLGGRADDLKRTMILYKEARQAISLGEGKLPGVEGLRARLGRVAGELGNEEAIRALEELGNEARN